MRRSAGYWLLLGIVGTTLACVPREKPRKSAVATPDKVVATDPQPEASLPMSAASQTDVFRKQLQTLRVEAVSLVRSLPENAVVDGLPLLRREGQLTYWDFEEVFPQDVAWVLDPWGHPIVILQSDSDSEDWCLASAGPDRRWTSDGLDGFRTAGLEEYSLMDFVARAPHYHGAEEPLHRTVLGDDVVLHAPTGLFFRSYSYPLPPAQMVTSSLVTWLRQQGTLPLTLSPDLVEEVEGLTREERDLAAAFVDSHAGRVEFCEDTWSHECLRKDGLLPRLYLCLQDPAGESAPSLWLEPQEGGWAFDWDVDELFAALEEGTGRERDESSR